MTDRSDERLYEAYRRERDIGGLSHAQILALGIFPAEDAERYALRFSVACSRYAEAMRNRDRYEHPGIGACGRSLTVSPYPPRIPERKG
jgi:hypothetical protein